MQRRKIKKRLFKVIKGEQSNDKKAENIDSCGIRNSCYSYIGIGSDFYSEFAKKSGSETTDDSEEGKEEMEIQAFFDSEKNELVLETSKVRKVVSFTDDGKVGMTSYVNLYTDREYVKKGRLSAEFSAEADGRHIDGTEGGYVFDDCTIEKTVNEVTDVHLIFHKDSLSIDINYLVYPLTSVIEQTVTYKNAGSKNITVTDPSILNLSVFDGRVGDSDFFYMTGAGILQAVRH